MNQFELEKSDKIDGYGSRRFWVSNVGKCLFLDLPGSYGGFIKGDSATSFGEDGGLKKSLD